MNTLLVLVLSAVAAASQPHVWFVDNARPADGDGTLAAPFRTIGAAEGVAQIGDTIYVFHGAQPYREPVALREGQLLAGEGSDVPGAPSAAPAPPVIDGGSGTALALAPGSSATGVILRAAVSGHALVAANASGNISVAHTAIEGNVSVDGGSGAFDFDATPINASLSIRNRTGGSVRFRNGSSVTGPGMTLYGNQGEIVFTDPLHLTGEGATALHIQSSGRVTMSSPASTVVARKAAAVKIADTGISIVLQSVSFDAQGAAVPAAIVVDNAPGTLRIAGGTIRGADERAVSIRRSSGVTLENLVIEKTAPAAKATPGCANLTTDKDVGCSAAVHLVDASDITLDGVKVDGSGQIGIFGDNIANLTLRGVSVLNAGDEAGEHGVVLRSLHGKSLFENVTLKNAASRQLFIFDRDGDGSLEIRAGHFVGAPPPKGQQGMLLQLGGTAKFALTVADSAFADTFSDAIHVIAEGSAQVDVNVTGSQFARVNAAIDLAASGESHLTYRIAGNTETGASAAAINVNLSMNGGSSTGTIADNTIGRSGVAGSGAKCGGCSGIAVTASHGAAADVTISGNTIQEVDGSGIRLLASGNAAVRAAIRRNVVREPVENEVSAISIQAGSRPADAARVCLDLADNEISGGWGIALIDKGSAPMRLIGATESAGIGRRNKNAAVKLSGTAFAPAASCGER